MPTSQHQQTVQRSPSTRESLKGNSAYCPLPKVKLYEAIAASTCEAVCTEVPARERLVFYFNNSEHVRCMSFCPLKAEVHYWGCPLIEIPLYT